MQQAPPDSCSATVCLTTGQEKTIFKNHVGRSRTCLLRPQIQVQSKTNPGKKEAVFQLPAFARDRKNMYLNTQSQDTHEESTSTHE
jgi:hypothetical protein